MYSIFCVLLSTSILHKFMCRRGLLLPGISCVSNCSHVIDVVVVAAGAAAAKEGDSPLSPFMPRGDLLIRVSLSGTSRFAICGTFSRVALSKLLPPPPATIATISSPFPLPLYIALFPVAPNFEVSRTRLLNFRRESTPKTALSITITTKLSIFPNQSVFASTLGIYTCDLTL